MDKKKIPLPRPDPRPTKPMNVQDHPTHNFSDRNYLDGIDAYKAVTTALGPKTAYQVETSQIGQAVDISENVPRRQND